MTITTTNTFGAFRLSMRRQLPKPTSWIPGLIMRNSVMMLSGQPKIGKSAMMALLAKVTATGSPFFGREVPEGEVLLICGERAHQTEDRIRDLFQDERGMHNVMVLDTEDERFPHAFRFDTSREAVEANVKFVRDKLQIAPSLIVIDTLTSFFEGEIIDARQMKEFFDGVRRMCRPFGASAIVLHHDNKEYVQRNGQRSGGGSFNGSIQALAKADGWIRAVLLKEVPDPDDPYGIGTIKIVRFELVEDNYGGAFRQTVAVRKQLEDATPYLDQADELRDEQKQAMLHVLENHPLSSESGWRELTVEHYPQFEHNLGNSTFARLRKELIKDGLVVDEQSPTRADWRVYRVAE